MTLSLDLDALEICWCKRLICDTPDCDVLRRMMAGEFYTQPDTRDEREDYPTDPPVLTVEAWRSSQWGAVA